MCIRDRHICLKPTLNNFAFIRFKNITLSHKSIERPGFGATAKFPIKMRIKIDAKTNNEKYDDPAKNFAALHIKLFRSKIKKRYKA